MAAANEAGEGEVVFALSMLLLVAAIQDFLAAIPDCSADQGLVTSFIDVAAVFELARVYQFSQNFVKRGQRHLAFALPKTESLLIGFRGKGLDRVLAACKPSEQARH
jgi:hypothetical protein